MLCEIGWNPADDAGRPEPQEPPFDEFDAERTSLDGSEPAATVDDENSPGAILVDAVHEQWLAEGTE